jgi:uridine phosphorylase
MPFPLHPDKLNLSPLLSAAQMIDFRRQHGLAGIQPPQSIILCLYKGVMQHFWLRYRSTRVKGFLGDLYLLSQKQGRVGVMGNFGIGSPVVASLADELAAWGVKRLILLSLAGGLQPQLSPGSLVIANSALRDEGASYHYLPPAQSVDASASLVTILSQAFTQLGLAPTIGTTWSTDAPYRESREEADQYRSENIQTVDMESAGLFAVGQARNLETASVFIVGDSLAPPHWTPPPNMRPLHQKIKLVLKILIDTL